MCQTGEVVMSEEDWLFSDFALFLTETVFTDAKALSSRFHVIACNNYKEKKTIFRYKERN